MNPLHLHAASAAAVLCSAALLLTTVLATDALNITTTPPSPSPDACRPATCGHQRIAYPFWLSGTHPPECGYRAFRVTCDANGTATLQNSFWMYQILHISYDDSAFTVANDQLFGDDACNVEMLGVNVSSDLGVSPFGISPANKELFFLYNCTELRSPPPPAWAPVGCTGGDGPDASATFNSYAWLADGYKPDDDWSPVEGNCTVSMMPVLGYEGAAGKDYRRLMKDGFLLNYTYSVDDCATCVDSGGLCRIDTTNNILECQCADGISSDPFACDGDPNRTGMRLGIGFGVLGVGVIIGFFAFLVWYKHKKRKQARTSSNLMRSGSSMSCSKDLELGGSHHIFTFEELEEATDGFSASRELGEGGFGTVYKGKLKDGRVVAVKRLYKNSYKRVEQFLNEVDILSRLLHQNLVILYGCTSRVSRDLLLVYEFIPNGTVADHLHGSRSAERGLTWPLRLSIAIETAEALSYLHAVEIIHRDVKTTNILLDNSFHVKVADFGLSRLFPLEVTHVSTVPQGTPGYVDPVYHQCYKLTDKSDVYSFGVVLVELISSKPAVDMSRSNSEINLANMALNRIQNHEVIQLVDPELGYDTDSETKSSIDRVAEVALQCLQLERELRPSIKEVVEILNCIRDGDCPAKNMSNDASQKEDIHLLKGSLHFSPDSVIHRFHSQSTNHSVASSASGV
ncbi:unnamed protein product [Alopecurus aequalis]